MRKITSTVKEEISGRQEIGDLIRNSILIHVYICNRLISTLYLELIINARSYL